jgi:hypothetical protein
MSKNHLKIIVAISVIVVCTASIGYIAYSGVQIDWLAGKWDNHYTYQIEIETDKPLYNVTLYLPILMKGEAVPDVVDDMIDELSGENWSCNIVETEYGKMLKMSIDTIVVGSFVVVRKEVKYIINTKDPVGKEPIFYPRLNETTTNYQTCIYGNYNTSLDTNFTIRLYFSGWKDRGVLGAIQIKKYTDTIETKIIGESHGWHVVNGILKVEG